MPASAFTGGSVQLTAEKGKLSLREFRFANLTAETDWPLRRHVPGTIFETSDIVLLHILVHLKVEALILASVADISIELNRVAVPLEGNQGFFWRSWWVDASHPLAGVQGVRQGPARVPVASHPSVVVVSSSLGVKKSSSQATLVPKTGAIGAHLNFLSRFFNLPFLYIWHISVHG